MNFPHNIFELGQMFSAPEACEAFLFQVRYPEGYVCRKCGGTKHGWVGSRNHIVRCEKCKDQVSLTSGTAMHQSHLSLCDWFVGAYLMTTETPSVSALQLQRQLGYKRYEPAFQMLHKLRAVMVRPDQEVLEGDVEMDETFIGGHRIGRGGRGALGKALVLGAVERIPTKAGHTRAGRCRLRVVEHADSNTILSFLQDYVAPGSTIHTDGWAGYEGIEDFNYAHDPFILQRPEDAARVFPHIHRVFGNLKAWIIGTFHGVSPKHIQAYLNEYAFRFNRRFTPWETFMAALGLASEGESPTYQELYRAGSKEGWEHPNPLTEREAG